VKGIVFEKEINDPIANDVSKVRLMEKFGMTPEQVDNLPLDLVEITGVIGEADKKKAEWESKKNA